MKNIIDVASDLLKTKETITTEEIKDALDEMEYSRYNENEILTIIHNDMLLSGLYFFEDDYWKMKEKITMKAIHQKEYLSLESLTYIEDPDDEELIIADDLDEDEDDIDYSIGMDEDEEEKLRGTISIEEIVSDD